MKVLYSASNASMKNGASRCLFDIVRSVGRYGITPIVCVPVKGELCDLLKKFNIKYYVIKEYTWVWRKPIGSNFNFVKRLKYFFRKFISNNITKNKIYKIIKKEGIEIIHINALTTYIASLAALKANIPYVWHIREFMEEDLESEFCSKKYFCKLLNKASKILCISNAIMNKYSPILQKEKLELVYDGVDTNIFHSAKHIPFSAVDVKILMLGRFVRTKGQFDLVRAVDVLTKNGMTNLSCKLVGQFAEQEYVSRIFDFIRNNNLENIITLCNYTKHPEDEYSQADILCVCSNAEAFGLVTVEGMLSGCLIIGSNTGCTVELVKNYETGLLYTYGNFENLADKIKWAIAHTSKAREYANRGCEFAERKFSLDRNVNSIVNIYQSILR